MKDQIIITMGREHGSGGHYIADMIARAYDLTVKSDVLGMEGTAEMLIRYIRAFQEKD